MTDVFLYNRLMRKFENLQDEMAVLEGRYDDLEGYCGKLEEALDVACEYVPEEIVRDEIEGRIGVTVH